LLLGLVPDPGYRADVAERRPSYARRRPSYARRRPSYARRRAVCVTDGVTERTDGPRQFDDDGLARLITGQAA
jgi:hypothetical protein